MRSWAWGWVSLKVYGMHDPPACGHALVPRQIPRDLSLKIGAVPPASFSRQRKSARCCLCHIVGATEGSHSNSVHSTHPWSPYPGAQSSRRQELRHQNPSAAGRITSPGPAKGQAPRQKSWVPWHPKTWWGTGRAAAP